MNDFKIFSRNGIILPIADATVSLFNIEYSYGYGVYETLKIRGGILYFSDYHIERLRHSATTLKIALPFSDNEIKTFLNNYVEDLNTDACNIKIVVIGGKETSLFIFASAPLFPDRDLYKKGAALMTYIYERLFPTAKTLNMLPSYIAYKTAKELNCYDALLIDKNNIMLEGTRTNFCLIRDTTIFSAPKERVLEGITLLTLCNIAKKEGFSIVEKEISLNDLNQYEGAFITSTSTKLMPVSKIDDIYMPIPDSVKKLMEIYDTFLHQEHET